MPKEGKLFLTFLNARSGNHFPGNRVKEAQVKRIASR